MFADSVVRDKEMNRASSPPEIKTTTGSLMSGSGQNVQ